jgi:hypothetical protein
MSRVFLLFLSVQPSWMMLSKLSAPNLIWLTGRLIFHISSDSALVTG